MNRQEMFDVAVKGLASQGFARSEHPRSKYPTLVGCAYRGFEGRKCAVGWLISDEKYYPGLEGATTRELLEVCGTDVQEYRFLKDLQSCHDNGKEPDSMKKNLRLLASDYYLDLPPELL